MITCSKCGYDDSNRVYFKRNDKVYCDKCYNMHVKQVYPDILRCSVTCPFCERVYEFDGLPDIDECSCGAKADYRFDEVLTFIRWDDDN